MKGSELYGNYFYLSQKFVNYHTKNFIDIYGMTFLLFMLKFLYTLCS